MHVHMCERVCARIMGVFLSICHYACKTEKAQHVYTPAGDVIVSLVTSVD